MAERQSDGPSSVKVLEQAYGDLVWHGWCYCDTGDDGPEREASRASIRERALADGLRVHDEVVFDRSLHNHEIGEWIVLVRLELPDGTLPPDPAYPLDRRGELRTQLESAWGDVLTRARAGHEERPRENERESQAEHRAALIRYFHSRYPRRLWTDIRRRVQKKRPLGSFGRRW